MVLTSTQLHTQADLVADPNIIRLSRGEGYGGCPYIVGKPLRTQQHEEVLFVLSASERYIREDGMSFGVGDDSGYMYSATARVATEEEARPLLEGEAKQAARKIAEGRIRELEQIMRAEGERPAGMNFPEGETLSTGDGQTIYGGGTWWVLGEAETWYVHNNGADGDNWEGNNVRTGGAGAIGWVLHGERATEIATEVRAAANTLGG